MFSPAIAVKLYGRYTSQAVIPAPKTMAYFDVCSIMEKVTGAHNHVCTAADVLLVGNKAANM